MAPSKNDLASADFGKPIDDVSAQVSAKRYLDRNLKDPESARVRWLGVKRAWIAGSLGEKTSFGYALTAAVNARNSFGGYTGEKQYFFFFRDSILIGGIDVTKLPPGTHYGFVE